MRKSDQPRILGALLSRVTGDLAARGKVDDAVADSVYHELRRLHEDRSVPDEERAFWARVQHGLSDSASVTRTRLLEDIVQRHAHEICGQFDERVYDVVSRAGEPLLGLLFHAVSPKKLWRELPHLPRFDDAVVLQGEIAQLRRLRERGTVLLVPTHVSHMDSIAVGYALWKLGFPPFLYGAGLNLFSNPMLGFFMRNLGAYTVDRRKQDPLYKAVLKEYATLTLENDYDNIFFPGGTRSRSGAVEKKLKLGLLGTTIGAYVNNLKNGKTPRERIYVVPATLSFQLVLEAETLVDDFLKEQGKARYIITDDEFSKPRRVFDFMSQLVGLDSKIYFTVGRALDPFGNAVDDDGESLDPLGRRIDPRGHVCSVLARLTGGESTPAHDEQRDAEYTKDLGEKIAAAYARDTVVQTTHVGARALLNLLRLKNAPLDLLRLLRAGGKHNSVALRELYAEVRRLCAALHALNRAGNVRLSPAFSGADGEAEDIVADALRMFTTYHKCPALARHGDRVTSENRALLFYYANRLESFGLEDAIGLPPALSRDHRALWRSP